MEPLDLSRAGITDLNREAVSLKARRMLAEAGESPDGSYLHVVQLALWGIDSAGLDVDAAVVETVRAMPEWNAARLMNFFFCGPEQGFSIEGWEEAATPRDLAKAILAAIDSRTFSAFPCYRAAD